MGLASVEPRRILNALQGISRCSNIPETETIGGAGMREKESSRQCAVSGGARCVTSSDNVAVAAKR
jgi:hypothetical protein